uniref:Signal-induced proliferation-associated 1 like 1 n=1 Tax=Eptatretus burgeri TaxID=7764 RepID=A0A8C4Q2U9_EPTBU
MAGVKPVGMGEKVGPEHRPMAGSSRDGRGAGRMDEHNPRHVRLQNGGVAGNAKAEGSTHLNGAPAVPRMGVRARVSEWPPKKEPCEEGGWSGRDGPKPHDGMVLVSRPFQPAASPVEARGVARMKEKEDTSMQKPARRQRSNSDAMLPDSEVAALVATATGSGPTTLHREYGSTSSIDKQGNISGDGFGALLHSYSGHDEQDGDSPVVSNVTARVDWPLCTTELDKGPVPSVKEHEKLLKRRSRSDTGDNSIFRKLRSKMDSDAASEKSDVEDGRADETPWVCQKCFAHYDVQSILFDLRRVASSRHQLGKRVNTTTGASAASQAPRSSSSPSGSIEDLNGRDFPEMDSGDGKSNELLLACPYFRNEIGGEGERHIGLTRNCTTALSGGTAGGSVPETPSSEWSLSSHCTNAGVSVLEVPRESQTLHCEKVKRYIIEHIDLGAYYYHKFFHGKEHQNYFGVDDNLGPVALSLRREKLDEGREKESSHGPQYNYRIIFRTCELQTLRGAVLEDAIPSTARHGTTRGLPLKEVLECVIPEVHLSCLRLAPVSPRVAEQLLKLDEQGLSYQHKVGIMYCKANQSTEEEMYNNETAGPAFDEFLELLGERVRLRGFKKYRAQLDNQADSTGTRSLYTTYKDYEIMFHVSTMLPYTPNNRQQLLRKRHIGNDIVTIVFQEPGALPFTPKNIRSHFQHVFVIIHAHNPCSETTCYSVAVTRSKDVPPFGPPIPKAVTFPKSAVFRDFLLAKVINGENAAHKSEKFRAMAARTRQEYLRDLAENYVTTTTVDSAARNFGFIALGGKRKEKSKPRLGAELACHGALVWAAKARDYSGSAVTADLDCLLGISNQVVVLVNRSSRGGVVFNCSTRDIIGWTSGPGALRVYYERGECVDLALMADDVPEVVPRLQQVTRGCETRELTLRRNSLGQLGFHVNYEGVVADVEQYGFAWQAGLRQGSRLVEICKVAVATLSHEQMIDLLRTSVTVKVVIIPPHEDGLARRGFSEHCRVPMVDYKFGETTVPFEYNCASFKAGHWQRSSGSGLHAASPASRKSSLANVPLRQHSVGACSPHSSSPVQGKSGALPRSLSTEGKMTETQRCTSEARLTPVCLGQAPVPSNHSTAVESGPHRRHNVQPDWCVGRAPLHLYMPGSGKKVSSSLYRQDDGDGESPHRSRSNTLDRERSKYIEPTWHVPAGKAPSNYKDSPARRLSRQETNGRDSPCKLTQGQERRYSSHSSSNTLSSTGSSSASEERWGPAGEACRDAEAGTAPVAPAALDSGIDTTTPRGTPLASRAASRAASSRARGQAYTPAEERSELLSGSPTMQNSVQGGKAGNPVEQGKAAVGDRTGSTPTSYFTRQGSGIFLRGWKKPDSSSNLDCRR